MIEVVAAIIVKNGRFLVGRRPFGKAQGGLWEFMGGKVEACESKGEALKRECREELALEIYDLEEVASVLHEYPEKKVNVTFIFCVPKDGSQATALEHSEIKWVTFEELFELDFCPADYDFIKENCDILRAKSASLSTQ